MPPHRQTRRLVVRSQSAGNTRAILCLGNHRVPCALGRGAIRAVKREGDGATPAGVFELLSVLYRRDRVPRPTTRLPLRPIRARDGWCDAPLDPNYNRPVTLPYHASAETMARTDRLYDIVVVLDYNVRRRSRNRGSAIFFHIASPGFRPTEGCIAVTEPHMRRLLACLDRSASIVVGAHVARSL